MTESLKEELIFALRVLIRDIALSDTPEEKLRILIRSGDVYVVVTKLRIDDINKALKLVGVHNPLIAGRAMFQALENNPKTNIPVIIIDEDNTGQMYLLTHGILY
jgi:hypothetical protein